MVRCLRCHAGSDMFPQGPPTSEGENPWRHPLIFWAQNASVLTVYPTSIARSDWLTCEHRMDNRGVGSGSSHDSTTLRMRIGVIRGQRLEMATRDERILERGAAREYGSDAISSSGEGVRTPSLSRVVIQRVTHPSPVQPKMACLLSPHCWPILIVSSVGLLYVSFIENYKTPPRPH